MDKIKTVLVTAIGTATATTIVTELKATGNYYIIGTDINPPSQIATSKDVDEFYVFPSSVADQEKYINYVADFCREHKVDYYFAVIDEEIMNISNHRELFAGIGVTPCIPNHKLVETCHYKNRFAKWVEETLPANYIKTFSGFDSISESDYPIFIKPVEGRASIGCAKVDSEAELRSLIDVNELGETVIAQKYVEGDVITVDMVRSAATGSFMQSQRKELIRNSNGCGIAVETINSEELRAVCTKIAEELDLNGVINAEFFSTGDSYKIIEINPRFSAGTSFSCLSGCDLVNNAIKAADGEDITVGPVTFGKHFARRYETYEL